MSWHHNENAQIKQPSEAPQRFSDKLFILCITQAPFMTGHYLHNKYICLINMEIKTQQLVFTMHFLHELPEFIFKRYFY